MKTPSRTLRRAARGPWRSPARDPGRSVAAGPLKDIVHLVNAASGSTGAKQGKA